MKSITEPAIETPLKSMKQALTTMNLEDLDFYSLGTRTMFRIKSLTRFCSRQRTRTTRQNLITWIAEVKMVPLIMTVVKEALLTSGDKAT